jgi:hypothetical protein
LALYILPFTTEKLYNNAVYVFKYWHSLKMATDSSQNMQECFYIQELVQCVGNELVYL